MIRVLFRQKVIQPELFFCYRTAVYQFMKKRVYEDPFMKTCLVQQIHNLTAAGFVNSDQHRAALRPDVLYKPDRQAVFFRQNPAPADHKAGYTVSSVMYLQGLPQCIRHITGSEDNCFSIPDQGQEIFCIHHSSIQSITLIAETGCVFRFSSGGRVI